MRLDAPRSLHYLDGNRVGVTYHPTNDGKQPTMTAIKVHITSDEYDQYHAALMRALECQEIVVDEETYDALDHLVGALEGSYDSVYGIGSSTRRRQSD